jgi:hypothetical protein
MPHVPAGQELGRTKPTALALAKLRLHSRSILSAIALFLAFAQMWVSRGYMDPDGISYSDIAKAYLRGDWHNALNSYWSPLYSWFLAIGYFLFRPSLRWEIFVSHVINFLGFAAALFAWNWLLREWERWQGPPHHKLCVELTSFFVITWAGLYLVTVDFTSADMEVLAIVLAVAAVLIRIRRGVASTADFVYMGLCLGFAFLAKAALATLIPVVLLEAAVLLHRIRDRRVWLAAALALLVTAPFITALSISKGHFVMSDTGKVNYSAHVTGMSLEGWKDNAYWPGTLARHPISTLLDFPRVTGFESHLVGTVPLHYDPAWWWEGYPVAMNWPRQLMVLRSNTEFCLRRFAHCPALVFAVICLLMGAVVQMLGVLRESWFIWLLGAMVLGQYCVVYTLNRYCAAGFILLAFCVISCCWRVRLPAPVATGTAMLIVLLCVRSGKPEFVGTPRAFLKDMVGRGNPEEIADITIAENMKRAGLAPGDRVALIGNSLDAAWLSLLGGTVVAAVPETIRCDDRRVGRPQIRTFEKSDAFWRSEPAAKERVFTAFRKGAAKWVVAYNVPKQTSIGGWRVAGHFHPEAFEKYRNEVYYKKLD